MPLSEAQQKAARELADLVGRRLGAGGTFHPATAIASAARLAGSLLLRSFDFGMEALEPGEVVLSDQANAEGPQLISTLSAGLHAAGVVLDERKLDEEPANGEQEPRLSVLESLALLQQDALRIARGNGLTLEEAAHAGGLATAFIIKELSSDAPEVGFNVAAYGFLEGCKTVPPPVDSRAIPSQPQT